MRRLLLALLALFWADAAVASTELNYSGLTSMTFQNGVLPTAGYAGISDTRLDAVDTDRNFGSGALLYIGGPSATGGQQTTLFSADLSALPDSAVVYRARLWMYQVSRVASTNAPDISLFRLYNPFTVGTGDSTASATGSAGATWSYRTSGVAWGGAGATTRGANTINDNSWSSMQALAATDTAVGTTAFAGSDTTDGSSTSDTPTYGVSYRLTKAGSAAGNQYYKQTGWVSFDITTLVRQAVNGSLRTKFPVQTCAWAMVGDEFLGAAVTGLLIYPSSDYTYLAGVGKGGKVYRPKIIVEYFDPTSGSSGGGRRVIGNGPGGLH